jgi:hypothetical protein
MFEKLKSIKKIFQPNNSSSVTQIPAEQPAGGRAIPYVQILGETDDSMTFDYDFLESGLEDFDYDDETTALEDPIISARLDKLLSDAQTYKEDFIWENVTDEMRDFITNLNNTLDWDAFNRYVFSGVGRKYSVIQILWENVEFEMLFGILYPAEQRIIGFKHEDPRNFSFNSDLTKGNLGDLIYNPTDENYSQKYPYNFIVYKHKNSYEHSNGRSELRELKKLILFKNILLKIQARYCRKAVIPSFAAIWDTALTGDQLTAQSETISEELTKIENGSGIAIPNLKSLIVLSPTTGMDFEKTFDRIDKIITIKIQGTDLLTASRTTTFASSKTGKELVEQTTKQIAKLLQREKNRVLEIAANNRFGFDSNKPQFQYDLTTKFDLETYKAMFEWGIEPDFDAFSKTFPVAKGYEMTELGGFPIPMIGKILAEQERVMSEDELAEDAERKQEEEQDDLEQ